LQEDEDADFFTSAPVATDIEQDKRQANSGGVNYSKKIFVMFFFGLWKSMGSIQY
jgi:hypothetical protein